MLVEASERDVRLAHDAFYAGILAYSEALNHVLENGGVQTVTESIRKLASAPDDIGAGQGYRRLMVRR